MHQDQTVDQRPRDTARSPEANDLLVKIRISKVWTRSAMDRGDQASSLALLGTRAPIAAPCLPHTAGAGAAEGAQMGRGF